MLQFKVVISILGLKIHVNSQGNISILLNYLLLCFIPLVVRHEGHVGLPVPSPVSAGILMVPASTVK